MCGLIRCAQLKQEDALVSLNPLPLSLIFSLVFHSLPLHPCIIPEGVCRCFFFLGLKASKAAALQTHLDSVHLTLLLIQQTRGHSCKNTHARRYTRDAASLHICSSTEACASFINAQVSSHIQLVYIYSDKLSSAAHGQKNYFIMNQLRTIAENRTENPLHCPLLVLFPGSFNVSILLPTCSSSNCVQTSFHSLHLSPKHLTWPVPLMCS